MENEVWKDIPSYEGLYQISNLGRVKSLKRKVYAGRGKMRWQYERILSDKKTNGNGYKVVNLRKNGKGTNKYIHRLVAETFIENTNNYKCINHKDENKNNNRAENLEWCTYKYNNRYNDKHIKTGKKLINNKSISKRILQLDENDNIIKEYPSIAEASRTFGVSNQVINDCLKGKQKHSAGYKWKYAEDQFVKNKC